MVDSKLGPVIHTERLMLRPPAAEDFAGFTLFHADEETMRFLGGVQSAPVVWRSMRAAAGAWALDGFGMFSVVEKASGDWIGRIGPIHPHGWPGREVGWGLHSSYWGRGFAQEAVVAAMDFAFDRLGWDHAIHTIDPKNERSLALARRLGSVRQGPGALPEPFAAQTVDIWGQSAADWWTRNRGKLLA